MYYKQAIQGIEVVVLTLDGGLLDINRLRYNYFNRLCKKYQTTITKEDFTKTLGNMYTMYNDSPIQKYISNLQLNDVVEKDLFAYAKLKPNIRKEGIEELLQFLVQKNIKIVVYSTHKTKRAIQYLQLTKLHKYVDYVIGGDSDNAPLPDASVLQTICSQMKVEQEKVLVVANFPNMVLAANYALMNVVYVPDLVPANPFVEASAYRVAKNHLEVINLFLFAKYDDLEMYSPILGMSSNMDVITLQNTYEHLLKEYGDDQQILALVEQTYRYFLREINSRNIKEGHLERVSDVIIESEEIEEEAPNIPIITNHLEAFADEDQEAILYPEQEAVVLEGQLNIDDFKKQANSLNQLMDQINGTPEPTADVEKEPVFEEPKEASEVMEITTGQRVLSITVDIIYNILVSTIITFIGILIYIVTEDYLNQSGIIPGILSGIVNAYVQGIIALVSFIFSLLHAILFFIPNYEGLIAGSSILSGTGTEILIFIIINAILVAIFKKIFTLLRKNGEEYDY